MHWAVFVSVVAILGFSTATAETTSSSTGPLNLGPLNFLLPVLQNVLGNNTLGMIQTNFANLLSGDVSKTLGPILPFLDPFNIIRPVLTSLSNYQAHMFDPAFLKNVGGVMKGVAKAASGGIQCFTQNLKDILANVTQASVDAMNAAFESNKPNTTDGSTSQSLGSAAFNTAKIGFQLAFSSTIRNAFIAAVREYIAGFKLSYDCVMQNSDDLRKSWQALNTQMNATAAPAAANPATAAPSSGFLGIF